MSFVDQKFIGLVSVRLQKFSKKKEGLYNFRCPYCGDSERNKNKTRGYIYRTKNDHNFKCHNCGISRSFTYFLKDQDVSLYDQYIMERYKSGLTGKATTAPNPVFKSSKPVFSKKDFDLPRITELNNEHPARIYLENRKIPKEYLRELYFCENFKEWTNKQKHTFDSIQNDESRVIIPLKNNGKIFGFQGRSLDKYSKVKYITVMLDDNQPKIYGLDKVDFDKDVYVVEGPIDSMFLKNSIAMVGADLDKEFFSSKPQTNFVMVYDNEKRNKQIVNRMEKVINAKFPIVVWNKDIEEKDINDMFLAGMDIQETIESSVYRGLEAKVKFTEWKKV